MRALLITALAMAIVTPPTARSQNAQTFDEAVSLSARQGKPLLLEFFVDD